MWWNSRKKHTPQYSFLPRAGGWHHSLGTATQIVPRGEKNIPNCFEKKETSEGLFRAIPSSTERNLSQSDAFIPPYCCNQQKWTWKGTSQEGMNVTMAHQQYRVGESKTF